MGHSEVHNEYTHDPLVFSNAPHIQISQSPSGDRIPAEHPIDFLNSNFARMFDEEDNFDTPFGSQTFNKPISQVASSRTPVPQVTSFVRTGERPLETFKDALNHVIHGTPQSKQPMSSVSKSMQTPELSTNLCVFLTQLKQDCKSFTNA